MFDMSNYVTRYFDVKLKNGTELQLEPPKLKVLRKMAKLSKINDSQEMTEEDINNLSEAMMLALNKNKTNYVVSIEDVEETFDIDLMYSFLTSFFHWVSEIQNQKN